MDTFHIIDDEPDIRRILTAILARSGCESLSFDSALAYVNYMKTADYKPPVAILSDYLMPGMDGYELVRHVRKRLPTQKIVIISGTPNDDFDESKQLCFTLQKPFQMRALQDLIQALVACHHTQCPANTSHTLCIFGIEHDCPTACLKK